MTVRSYANETMPRLHLSQQISPSVLSTVPRSSPGDTSTVTAESQAHGLQLSSEAQYQEWKYFAVAILSLAKVRKIITNVHVESLRPHHCRAMG